MTDDNLVEKLQEEIRSGDQALQMRDQEGARYHYQRALSYIEDIEDQERRRRQLGVTALALVRRGFPKLAIPIAQIAIELDEKIGHLRHLGEDLNTCGMAELNLGHLDSAEHYFERALKLCLENGDYDNAASTSTNLAIVIGKKSDESRYSEAIDLLRNSLSYLEKQKHDATEIITRMALIQVLEITEAAPEHIFEIARILFDNFGHSLRPDQWANTLRALQQAIERFKKLRPDIDIDRFKQERFPELLNREIDPKV